MPRMDPAPRKGDRTSKDVTIRVRVTAEVADELERRAKARGRSGESVSVIVREAIDLYLDHFSTRAAQTDSIDCW